MVEKNFFRELLDIPRHLTAEHGQRAYAEGFEAATTICMDVVAKQMEELMNRPGSGKFLSEHEQFLLSGLGSLRSEMERSLRESWSGDAESTP